jgi:hypothetical protein
MEYIHDISKQHVPFLKKIIFGNIYKIHFWIFMFQTGLIYSVLHPSNQKPLREAEYSRLLKTSS